MVRIQNVAIALFHAVPGISSRQRITGGNYKSPLRLEPDAGFSSSACIGKICGPFLSGWRMATIGTFEEREYESGKWP